MQAIKEKILLWLMDGDVIAKCPECYVTFFSEEDYKEHYKLAHKKVLKTIEVATYTEQ